MSLIYNLKKKVMKISRSKKFEHFFTLFEEGMSVLDVGVSKENNRDMPNRNYFLKHFPYSGEFYTGLGVQNISDMDKIFPGKSFYQYPGSDFPFKENQFDWIYSNAVIEHVGLEEEQLKFINEMIRVSDNVFFTTPNKYFPVESHTNVFFLHWNNFIFYRWLYKYRNGRKRESLYLFSYNRLKKILKKSDASNYKIIKNKIAGLTMTFTVVCNSKIRKG